MQLQVHDSILHQPAGKRKADSFKGLQEKYASTIRGKMGADTGSNPMCLKALYPFLILLFVTAIHFCVNSRPFQHVTSPVVTKSAPRF